MKILNREIGLGCRPYLIAEMSGNHNQSLERALEIVDSAAENGADAIKLQTYTADTMTLDLRESGFVIEDSNSLWAGTQLYELYKKAHTPWEWHKPIMDRASLHGMHCFSTPFDESSVDFLERLDVPAYKIASFECTDLPLVRRVAATGRPMIISTGMATAAEIDETVRAARDAGCKDLILLKCTSSYPATAANSNISTIPHMRALFGCEVGLSDHTMGCGVAVAATAMGATVIEKHFTLRRADGGVDSAFSMEPEELRQLREEIERAADAIGKINYGPTPGEVKSLIFRRSLYITQNLKAGQVLTRENLRSVRPGLGLPPKYMDILLGLRVVRDVPAGTPASWNMFEPQLQESGCH
jgi:pseudaminic acid synthase